MKHFWRNSQETSNKSFLEAGGIWNLLFSLQSRIHFGVFI